MATIATHNGSAVRQNHNIRTLSCLRKEPHIDPDGFHETWKHELISQAYRRLFDAAVKSYNARQTRADRKINNYHQLIKQDKRKHDCYEMIIGIYGDDVADETAYNVMRLFASSWQERNPNLELIGAYYHADEEGKNAHVHLDYIPIAHGYRRGPETQTGLSRALGEMGFIKDGWETAQIKWEARENKVLEDLCCKSGITVKHPQAGKEKVNHMTTEEFKASERLKAVKATLKNTQNTLQEAEDRLLKTQMDYFKLKQHNEDLRRSIEADQPRKWGEHKAWGKDTSWGKHEW